MQLRKDRVHHHGKTNKDEKYIHYKYVGRKQKIMKMKLQKEDLV